MVQPRSGYRTVIDKLRYTAGATAHTITFLRPLGRTTLTAAAAAGQAVINIAADPGDYTGVKTADNGIAANDYVAVETPDGTFHTGVVSSVASLAITLTANVPTGGFASGAIVWFFGISSDTDPNTGVAHPALAGVVSATTNYPATGDAILVASIGSYEPILVQSNNATNAGSIEHVSGYFTRAANFS